MSPEHRLHRLFAPRSIAVVGASTKPGYGRQTVENLAQLGYPGKVVAVHPSAEQVGPVEVYRSLREVPFVPDAVALAVPAAQVPTVVHEASELGVGGLVAYASGFRESGDSGRALERQLRAAAGDRLPVLGPNCLGLVNYGARTAMWGIEVPRHQQRGGGSVALASQSGAMLITTLLSGRLPDVAYAASVGNQTVLDLNDCLEYYLTDPAVRTVCLITEGIADLARFRRLADQARRSSVSVLALKLGRSQRGQAASVAHTGTLAGDDATYSAVFEQAGVCRVDDLDDLIATAALMSHLSGRAVGQLAVFATSGGEGGLVADMAEEFGVELAELDKETERRLTELVPPFGSVGNPFDLTAGAWGDAHVYERVTGALARCPGVGLVAMIGDAPRYLGSVEGSGWEQMLAGAGVAARATGVPAAVVTTTTDVLAEFRVAADREGVLLLAGGRPAMRAVAHAQAAAAAPIVTAADRVRGPDPATVASARALLAERSGALGESDSKALAAVFGISSPAGGEAHSIDDLLAIADRVGYPVVCKMTGLAHKSEVGGVVTGIQDSDQLRTACDRITRDAAASLAGQAVVLRVEQMVLDGLEVLVGGRRSATGVTVVVGAGGVLTEVVKDVRTLAWPFSAEDARRALTRLRIAPVLDGYRGRPAVNLPALVDVVVRTGCLLAALPEVVEIDLNPVMASAAGSVAVDALVVVANDEAQDGAAER